MFEEEGPNKRSSRDGMRDGLQRKKDFVPITQPTKTVKPRRRSSSKRKEDKAKEQAELNKIYADVQEGYGGLNKDDVLTAVVSCLWGPGMNAAAFWAKFPNWVGDFTGNMENFGAWVENVLSLIADAIDTAVSFYNLDKECFSIDCEDPTEFTTNQNLQIMKKSPKEKNLEVASLSFIAALIGFLSGAIGFQGALTSCYGKAGGNGAPVDPVMYLLYDVWGFVWAFSDSKDGAEHVEMMECRFKEKVWDEDAGKCTDKDLPGADKIAKKGELEQEEQDALKWGTCAEREAVTSGLYGSFEAMGTVIANWMYDDDEADTSRGWEANCLSQIAKAISKLNAMKSIWCGYKACQSGLWDENDFVNRRARSRAEALGVDKDKAKTRAEQGTIRTGKDGWYLKDGQIVNADGKRKIVNGKLKIDDPDTTIY